MARRRGSDLTVGAVFALGLLIVALAVMAVGGDSHLFSKLAVYRVTFPTVTGLVQGSPVKMSGVQIGTVRSISLATDPGSSGIEVAVGIDAAYAGRVREDSRAALRILQMLSGEKFVEISPGSPEQPELPQGEVIQNVQDPELLAQAAAAAENLTDITISLRTILASIESGETLVGQMFTDPEFGRKGLDDLGKTVDNLRRLSDDLVAGRGFVGRLLYDQDFAAKVDDLGRMVERMGDLLESVDVEQGALGALLEEGGPGEQAVVDLREAAASLKQLSGCLASEDGLMSRLFCDGEGSARMAEDLRATVANLAEISGKINRGEGTLGALINDRTVYDGMEAVIAGTNDSKFARWLLRHYQKKGIQAAEQAEDQAEQEQADERP
jgi:phospholipid/cholesterol/gamma-HCH transport system substrate-binding protein